VTQERYCSNCRHELPADAQSCPECGVFAGDVFDGRIPGQWQRWVRRGVLIALLAGTAAAWFVLKDRDLTSFLPSAGRDEPQPQARKVVPVSSGPVTTHAQAVRALRRHLVATRGIANDCLVLKSEGRSGGAWVLTVLDRCENFRLGRFRIDAATGRVDR
jgi:hypothetical protein